MKKRNSVEYRITRHSFASKLTTGAEVHGINPTSVMTSVMYLEGVTSYKRLSSRRLDWSRHDAKDDSLGLGWL